MIGVIAKFECPACGNFITHEDTVQKTKKKFCFEEPGRCGCGRKSGFALVSFRSAEVRIVEEEEGNK